MITVLLVEDDTELAHMLIEYLESYDMQVSSEEDPYRALSRIQIETYDILVLDLTLPSMDGLEFLQKLRLLSDIPVIISSARHDITDKIIGFERGADDYLPKPYNPRELEARIKNLLRRRVGDERRDSALKKEKRVTLNRNRMEIRLNGETLNLTHAEYGILAYLIENEESVISRDQLMESVDAISKDSSLKSIDVMMVRIRSKLGESPKEPKHIHAVRGVGFKFTQ